MLRAIIKSELAISEKIVRNGGAVAIHFFPGYVAGESGMSRGCQLAWRVFGVKSLPLNLGQRTSTEASGITGHVRRRLSIGGTVGKRLSSDLTSWANWRHRGCPAGNQPAVPQSAEKQR